MEKIQLPPIDSTIEEKIETARELFARFGPTLCEDRRVRRLLDDVGRKSERASRVMVETGVVATCKYCDEEEGGSCCGAGIENKYNSVLLLINLLLGVALPMARRMENSCTFLGERGCSLKVRHVLCINYLCHKIQRMLMPDVLARLQTATGEEMDAIFVLHEAVKERIAP